MCPVTKCTPLQLEHTVLQAEAIIAMTAPNFLAKAQKIKRLVQGGAVVVALPAMIGKTQGSTFVLQANFRSVENLSQYKVLPPGVRESVRKAQTSLLSVTQLPIAISGSTINLTQSLAKSRTNTYEFLFFLEVRAAASDVQRTFESIKGELMISPISIGFKENRSDYVYVDAVLLPERRFESIENSLRIRAEKRRFSQIVLDTALNEAQALHSLIKSIPLLPLDPAKEEKHWGNDGLY